MNDKEQEDLQYKMDIEMVKKLKNGLISESEFKQYYNKKNPKSNCVN